MTILEIIALCFIAMGLIFFLGGTVGILRLPDFYSRLHAAGKLDTLGSLNVLLGLALYSLAPISLLSVLTALKILLCMFFVFMASPSATHAIVDAGMDAGMPHWRKR
ncbi:MAG: sodium:proton antiporter [Desulfovibrio sp.]|nr:MAG: sodium:proton antiporter [Desulfovibrio sp.]